MIVKTFLSSESANILLTAAEMAGWKVTVLLGNEDNFATIEKNGLSFRLYKARISVNDSVSIVISKNKYLTHLVLKSVTPFVTHPTLLNISDVTSELLQDLLEKNSKLVVKPLDDDEGKGVVAGLTTVPEIEEAIRAVEFLGHTEVLIEDHVETTHEYRVVLWKGTVVDVLSRIPPYVVGDGVSTILKLIEQKNKVRDEAYYGLYEPLVLDDAALAFLRRSALEPSSVLSQAKHQSLKSTCNLDHGGEVERVDANKIHPEYLSMFKAVYEVTRLNYVGVDLITPDLFSPPTVGLTAINELNGAPGPKGALIADICEGNPFMAAKKLFQAIEADPPTY
jgi:D-alanine-D-alanine ligase-like ATP-grasp enzyme